MKKLFVSLICLVLLFCSTASADPWRVFDNAKLFSEDDIQTIEEAIVVFQRETNLDFAVLTTDDFLGSDNQFSIASAFYDYMPFGFGKQASGMLYYIDMNQRLPYVFTKGKMVSIFADKTLDNAHDACHTYLSTGDYKGAVLKMIEKATDAVTTTNKKDAN